MRVISTKRMIVAGFSRASDAAGERFARAGL